MKRIVVLFCIGMIAATFLAGQVNPPLSAVLIITMLSAAVGILVGLIHQSLILDPMANQIFVVPVYIASGLFLLPLLSSVPLAGANSSAFCVLELLLALAFVWTGFEARKARAAYRASI